MYTISKYLIEQIDKYKSFYNFYTLEFSNFISFFQFFNFLILILIFLILIIRFFIKYYTLKVFLTFLFKRFLFGCLVLFFFNFNSIFCMETVQSNSFLNNNTTKYTCIALVTITGCYLGYNYIPLWYDSVKNYTKYNKYLSYKQKEDKYNTDFAEYLKKVEEKKLALKTLKQNKLENKLEIETYTQTSEKFNLFLDNFLINYRNISNPITIFSTSPDIIKLNNFFNEYKVVKNLTPEYLNLYQGKFHCLFHNYAKIESIISGLKKNNCVKQGFNQDEVLITQVQLFESLALLFNFYGSVVLPFSAKITLDSGDFKDPRLIKDITLDIQINHLSSRIDLLLDKSLDLSTKMLDHVNAISVLPELIKPEVIETVIVNTSGFTSIVRPKKPKLPEELKEFHFSADNLEGIKFISINCGYLCFYPILYVSNKIFGTLNPLSDKLFKDALFFFFTGWF